MTALALALPASDTPALVLLCAVMTFALLWYVFQAPADAQDAPVKSRLAFLRERKETVYENLRDLNFEFKAGKIPAAEYPSMKAALEDEAAAILAEIDPLEPAPGDLGGEGVER